MPSMNVVVVHYAELGLKGGNRRMFERKLMEDIRARLSPVHAGRVRLESARVLVELTENHSPDAVRAELGKVFGVAWFAFGRLLPWGPGNPGWDAL
jgi:thiamine biosynthesis protein ThiI